MTPTKVWKRPERWARVSAKAVAGGSRAQMENVLEQALQDIAVMWFFMKPHTVLHERDLMEPIKFTNGVGKDDPQ